LLSSFAFSSEDSLSLYFNINEYKLSLAQKESIDSIIKRINGKENIIIKGYADYLGSDTYNKNLSAKRATEVKTELLKRGFKAEVIKCEGKGPVGKRSDLESNIGHPVSRRVDIKFISQREDLKPEIALQQVNQDDLEFAKELKSGEKIVWENLNFQPGRHHLLPESTPALEKLIKMLKMYPTMRISIEGHICCERYNDDGFDNDTGDFKLSLNRAKSVYDSLIKSGIHPDRLSYVGFGGKIPLVDPELTDADRAKNRRVEIKLLER
jgi:outer membrane protein OmpA-like peptidoglycan-associated protein